ncbi:MAG: PA2778 family cysteine peptidase [Desulfobacterales bacterium]|nr:PA2778 family cysteine peptidase [Desulfobacterales bacterium]
MYAARTIVLMVLAVLVMLPGCAKKITDLGIGHEKGLILDDTPFFPQEKYQCGPASLAMLLGASGVAVHPDALVPQTYLPGRRGSLQLELIAASRLHGRIPYVINPHIKALIAELKAGRPVLVLQNLGLNILPAYHYAVVIGMLPAGKVVLRSGREKNLEMDVERFLATWRRTDSWGMIALKPGVLPVDPDPNRYLSAVSAFESQGNILPAEHSYQAAVEAWPKNQSALFALANNYLSQNQYSEAESLYRKLLEINEEHVAASNNLAETLVHRGCYIEAFALINQASITATKLNSPLRDAIFQTQEEIKQHFNPALPIVNKSCNE